MLFWEDKTTIILSMGNKRRPGCCSTIQGSTFRGAPYPVLREEHICVKHDARSDPCRLRLVGAFFSAGLLLASCFTQMVCE
jgi:hypothetical protein